MNITNNVAAIQNNLIKFNESTTKIAKVGVDKNVDLAKEFTDQIIISNAIKANANVIKTSEELFDTLLDIKV